MKRVCDRVVGVFLDRVGREGFLGGWFRNFEICRMSRDIGKSKCIFFEVGKGSV